MLNRRDFLARLAALALAYATRPDDGRPSLARFSPDEIRVHQAMARYKRASGRGRPTWDEGIEVMNALGYHRPS